MQNRAHFPTPWAANLGEPTYSVIHIDILKSRY
jgi:hypothetical protein